MGQEQGWFAYAPLGGVVGSDASMPRGFGSYLSIEEGAAPDPHRRPELADLGRLARRGVRMVVGVARADEVTEPADVVRAHLGLPEPEIVSEAWEPYDGVNVQAERGHYGSGHPLLFQLLNEMDGLAGDSDVAFLLTTNRADVIEPALAARPGRIDQAIELALPDADARRRLFELYRGRLVIDADDAQVASVMERAAGVTASFLKELLRRAALFAAERGEDRTPMHVTADDLAGALDDLLSSRNRVTRSVLGSGGDAPDG